MEEWLSRVDDWRRPPLAEEGEETLTTGQRRAIMLVALWRVRSAAPYDLSHTIAQTDIADFAGVTTATVRWADRWMVDIGAMELVNNGRRSKTYRLVMPEPVMVFSLVIPEGWDE
jgi:hypothetical protein